MGPGFRNPIRVIERRIGFHERTDSRVALITVLDTPKLAITASSNSVVLSWPTAASGFTLEEGSTLSNWSAFPVTNVVVGDRYNVTNPVGTDALFFRLRKP